MSNFNTLNKAHGGSLEEYCKWRLHEEREFLKLKFRQNLKYKYELDMISEAHTALRLETENLKLKLRERTAEQSHSNYVFVTISPKPNVTFDKFKTTCIRYAQRKMFKKSWLVFEQRGVTEEELGKGFHAHIECERNVDYKPSQIIRNTKNTFKNQVDLKIPQTLTIQHHGNDYHKDKLEYIQGVKTGVGKDDKQYMDVKFREKENLNVCYKYYAEEDNNEQENQQTGESLQT